jgi:hypothetical protein
VRTSPDISLMLSRITCTSHRQNCCSRQCVSEVSFLCLVLPAPCLPQRTHSGLKSLTFSASLHASAVAVLLLTMALPRVDSTQAALRPPTAPPQIPRMVFLQMPTPAKAAVAEAAASGSWHFPLVHRLSGAITSRCPPLVS